MKKELRLIQVEPNSKGSQLREDYKIRIDRWIYSDSLKVQNGKHVVLFHSFTQHNGLADLVLIEYFISDKKIFSRKYYMNDAIKSAKYPNEYTDVLNDLREVVNHRATYDSIRYIIGNMLMNRSTKGSIYNTSYLKATLEIHKAHLLFQNTLIEAFRIEDEPVYVSLFKKHSHYHMTYANGSYDVWTATEIRDDNGLLEDVEMKDIYLSGMLTKEESYELFNLLYDSDSPLGEQFIVQIKSE